MITSEPLLETFALTPHIILILEQIKNEDYTLYKEIMETIQKKFQTLKTK
jgi:uncharacterized hydantoinase/oxoprolinase family protein